MKSQTANRESSALLVRRLSWCLPAVLFVHFFDLRWLVVTRVMPLLTADWATTLAGPNFSRSAPVVTLPVGHIPGYMAPVGTYIAQTDSAPLLIPLYHVTSWLMPDRPFQFAGWMILASLFATFAVARRCIRFSIARAASPDPLLLEISVIAGAVILVAQPFYLARIVHLSLFQSWILPLTLLLCWKVVDESRRGLSDASILVFVAPAALATALHPHLGIMVMVILCATASTSWATDRAVAAQRIVGVVLTAALTVFLMGYVGVGARTAGGGYGLYNADLLFLFDSASASRVLPSFGADARDDGFGFPGLGVLLLLIIAAVTAVRQRQVTAERDPNNWRLWLGAGLLVVWAMTPHIKFGGTVLLDLTSITDHFSVVTGPTRANGRFTWVFIWMLSTSAVGFLARPVTRLSTTALMLVAFIQVVDSQPPLPSVAPDNSVPIFAVLDDAKRQGVRHVEFQPPYITSDCTYAPWVAFEPLSQVIVASAALSLSVNSGYPARGSDAFLDDICIRQTEEYLRGEVAHDVLYVLPDGAVPIDPAMACTPMPGMLACRLPASTTAQTNRADRDG